MKRWMAWCLSLLLLLSLSACGLTAQEETEEETANGLTVQKLKETLYNPVVPESEAVSPDWFSDVAFVGDSVSVMLDWYNGGSGPLKADFFCSVSMSQQNALSYAAGDGRLPEYPKGSGRHPKLLDGLAESSPNKIYVMLGMNCIAGGVDRASQDLVTLIDQILERCPEAAVLVESVTPMTATSPRADDYLNNETIRAFNCRMLQVCMERKWYFVNVAEALSDENGFLRDDYSGDRAMGIHLNYNGAEVWTNYLLTHVPEVLK